MEKPKLCKCGGNYKRATPPGEKRDGSRYFKCNHCGARIEQTANGYEFRDAAPIPPPPVPVPVPPLPSRSW